MDYLWQECDAFEPLCLENGHDRLNNSVVMAAHGLIF